MATCIWKTCIREKDLFCRLLYHWAWIIPTREFCFSRSTLNALQINVGRCAFWHKAGCKLQWSVAWPQLTVLHMVSFSNRLGNRMPFDGASEPDHAHGSLKSESDILQNTLPENEKFYFDLSRIIDRWVYYHKYKWWCTTWIVPKDWSHFQTEKWERKNQLQEKNAHGLWWNTSSSRNVCGNVDCVAILAWWIHLLPRKG